MFNLVIFYYFVIILVFILYRYLLKVIVNLVYFNKYIFIQLNFFRKECIDLYKIIVNYSYMIM